MTKSSSTNSDALTGREHEIMGLVMQGLRNRGIAAALTISEATVENHLHHIFVKLGVDSRLAAVLKYMALSPNVAEEQ